MTYSYQLYSSRKFGPISETLKMLKAEGYSAVEGFGGLFQTEEDIAAFKEALGNTGLAMRTSHVGLTNLEEDPQGAIALARLLGAESLYVPHLLPEERPKTARGWSEMGARIEAAGKPLVEAGFGFGYHNHDFEFVQTDGQVPMASLLEGGPSLEWEIDVAWVVRGGADPVDWINRYKGRISAAHLKDIAEPGQNADEDGWADVGHGTMDWAGLMKELAKTNAKHFVMEHDNPSDDKRFAARALASVQSY